jgi:hypothetical protein
MLLRDGTSIRLRLNDLPSGQPPQVEDVAFVLLAVGHLYRLYRLMQFAGATGIQWTEYRGSQRLLRRWFAEPIQAVLPEARPDYDEPSLPEPPGLQASIPDQALLSTGRLPYTLDSAIAWIGGLRIETARAGSADAVIRAFGQGAGEGVSLAAQGVANALVTISTIPGEVRTSWAKARALNAEARLQEARAAAEEERVATLQWAGEVLRGERAARTDQYLYALEVQVQARIIGRQFANGIANAIEQDLFRLADLAEAKSLAPLTPGQG